MPPQPRRCCCRTTTMTTMKTTTTTTTMTMTTTTTTTTTAMTTTMTTMRVRQLPRSLLPAGAQRHAGRSQLPTTSACCRPQRQPPRPRTSQQQAPQGGLCLQGSCCHAGWSLSLRRSPCIRPAPSRQSGSSPPHHCCHCCCHCHCR
jgi:hypothetical protein